ncbi:Panacea domain-containing protein [Actinoplanes sp. RD1]|uniref:Panacea domain-containing protein n=1 Tax=Actinoplanes sp. RD1 TaxID=3064538 RepID=UPI002740C3A5|nr:Panacea domain-containing protein [Actinoplanes sp. RD1]
MFDLRSGQPRTLHAYEQPYHDRMTASARDVAAVLRDRLPGLPVKKLHKLLYYCQGHHLATFDEPLFTETISAWDMGPVVGALWKQEKEAGISPGTATLGEAELNTIGYVLSRYGALTGQDLENLTHSEAPWKLADRDRRPRESARIEPDWIKFYFLTSGAPGEDDGDDAQLDTAEVRRWLQEVTAGEHPEQSVDSLDDIRARLLPDA